MLQNTGKYIQNALTIGLFFAALFCSIEIWAQSSGGSNTNNRAETANKIDANLKSLARVNPSTLAMELNIPLGNYPGRNGSSVPVTVNYTSKLWEMNPSFTWFYFPSPISNNRKYITDNHLSYAKRTSSGWTSSLTPPRLDAELELYNQYGKGYDPELDETGIISHFQSIEDAALGGFPNDLMPSLTPCGAYCQSWGWGLDQNGYIHWGCLSVGIHYCVNWPENPLPGNPEPQVETIRMQYVKRIRIQMADGSTSEFRKSDSVFGFCYPNNPNNGTCDPGVYGEDILGEFLAVDGSGMRLIRSTTESILYMPDGGRYIFPPLTNFNDEQWYATEYISVDGNRLQFSQTQTTNGNGLPEIISGWKDTLGREIGVPVPMNWIEQTQQPGDQQYDLPGLANNSAQSYTFRWKKLKGETNADSALEDPNQLLSYESSRLCWGNTATILPLAGQTNGYLFAGSGLGTRLCNSFYYDSNDVRHPALFNPTVLSEVILPSGKSYEFSYNLYGEISKIKYPDGGYEKFVYGHVIPLSGANSVFYDQTNRGVKERFVYDVNDVLQQKWLYDEEINGSNYPLPDNAFYKIITISPKGNDPTGTGTKTERYLTRTVSPPPDSQYGNYGFQDPRTGMPYDERTYDENNNLRSRSLTEWIVAPPRTGGEPRATRDARAARTISISVENGQALAVLNENEYETPGENGSTAPTDPKYFAHLNVKRSRSHHFRQIPINLAETGNFAQIAAYFDSASINVVKETDYSYNIDYLNRGISSLPVETRVKDKDSNVLAKTQTVYDEAAYLGGASGALSGNLASTWIDPANDSRIPSASRGLRGKPTTSKLWDDDNNIWHSTSRQYDQYGNVRKAWEVNEGINSPRFVETEYHTDYGCAYPTKVITPAPDPTGLHGTDAGSFTTATYDFMTGLPLTSTNEFGQTTATEYNDPLLRPTRSYAVNFTAPETQTIYDDANLKVTVKKQIDTNNWDIATTYSDSLGRVVKTQASDSQGDIFVDTKYDFLGRVERVTNPYRAGDTVYWSKTRYDEMGRAVESYAPAELANLGSAESLGVTSFDISTVSNYVGAVVTTTDASGRKGRSITNALGQLIRVDEPTATGGTQMNDLGSLASPNQATSYKYDVNGKMVEVTQGVQKRWFKYDSLGRLIRVRQPEQEVNTALNLADGFNTSGQWTAGFTYDVMGNVLSATDAKGTVITNTYDKAGRVKTRTYSDSTPAVSFYYDGIGGGTRPPSPNYAKGKLTRVTSAISETQYQQFDNLGRLTQMAQITDGKTYTSKYTYNLAGALVEEEYPSGRKVRNEYESDGDLMKVESRKGGGNVYIPYVSNFSYTASGGISQMRLGNGLWETAKFNSRNQVTELGLGIGSASTGTWKTAYEYGELQTNGTVDATKNTGNIARQILTIPGTSFTQSYKYDSLYRLTEATEKTASTTNWTQSWTYDRYGNRVGFTQNIGGLTDAPNPTIDANTNRFNSGQGFTYDKNGNIINDVDPISSLTRQFVFNGDNKQTEVKKDGITIGRYYYDGEGKRIKKVTDTETTVFVYSGGKLIAEYSTAISSTPSISYTTTDHLGSPRIITDALGQVKSRRDFMPFGEDLFINIGNRTTANKYGASTDEIRQKFTGYQKDNETNLDFAEARMYANQYGRFTAVDPLLASGKSDNPQTFNRYTYTSNNPIDRVDANGLDWVKVKHTRVHYGRTYTTYQPVWKDKAYGETKWDKAVFKVGYGKNKGKWIAMDPWNNDFTVANSRSEAVAAYRGYQRQALIDAGGGLVQPLVDTVNAGEFIATKGQSLTNGQNGIGTQMRDAAFGAGGASVNENSGPFRSASNFSGVMGALWGARGSSLLGGLGSRSNNLVRVYRVEGNVNQMLTIGDEGSVAITGGNRTLFLNFGDSTRASSFLERRIGQGMEGVELKSFDVSRSYLDDLNRTAVPESMASQFPNAPIRVDTAFGNQFGLRPCHFEALCQNIVPGSGRVGGQ